MLSVIKEVKLLKLLLVLNWKPVILIFPYKIKVGEKEMSLCKFLKHEKCLDCSICILENTIESRSLNCDHKFHHNCINQWLTKNNTCPNCKQQINANESKITFRSSSLSQDNFFSSDIIIMNATDVINGNSEFPYLMELIRWQNNRTSYLNSRYHPTDVTSWILSSIEDSEIFQYYDVRDDIRQNTGSIDVNSLD